MIRKYIATARMAAYEKTNGGLLYLLPDIFMKVVYLVPVMFIWKSLAGSDIVDQKMVPDSRTPGCPFHSS